MKRTYIDSYGLMHQGTLEEIKQHMIAELEDILKEDLETLESIATMQDLENIAWEYDFEILETEEEFANTLYAILLGELEYMQKDNDYYMSILDRIFKK